MFVKYQSRVKVSSLYNNDMDQITLRNVDFTFILLIPLLCLSNGPGGPSWNRSITNRKPEFSLVVYYYRVSPKKWCDVVSSTWNIEQFFGGHRVYEACQLNLKVQSVMCLCYCLLIWPWFSLLRSFISKVFQFVLY